MSMTLYQIEESLRTALDTLVDPETGEIADDKAAELDALSGAFEKKAADVGAYILELNAEAKAIKEARDALAAREKAVANRAKWLKQYLLASMGRMGITKAESANCRVSVGKPRAVVNVTDISLLPQEFLRIKDPEVNKVDLLKALKDGREIPGAELAVGEPSIRIS